MDVLKGLNEEQIEAVAHTTGPLLVMAGAGSGKTKVITHRIAYLISKGISPSEILAVTFTNKAAEEMKDRISKLLDFPFHGKSGVWSSERNKQVPFASTFHSLGVYILREDGKSIGIPKSFSIIDEDDALKIIKTVLKELNLKEETFNTSRVRYFISDKKNRLYDYEDFLEDANDYFPKIMAEVWYRYEEKLKEQNSLDFDDLIIKTVKLFKNSPETLEKYQDKWKFVHIDEYQDTNKAQYILSKMLTEKRKNICAVGDSDQAIYSFRGADFTNILNFERDFHGAKVVILNKNYRSTQNILDTANILISHNKTRYHKELLSESSAGDAPMLFEAENETEEAEFVAKIILEMSLSNENTAAVLLRTNFQSRVFEEYFLRNDVPYQMIGVKFYERKEIKDTLAYLKYALNRNDFLSFGRMADSPSRGIGEKTILKHFKKESGIQPKKQMELNRLENLSDKILKTINKEQCSKAIKLVLDNSGYNEYLLNLGEEGERRLENIFELLSLSKKYDILPPPSGVLKLLEESALMSEQDNLKNNFDKSVKIITAHSAKGLEFDTVFAAGLEEGLFPYSSINDADKEMKIEEERRLFYVALTRARKNLFLSYAKSRAIFGERKINRPSRFLKEIMDKVVKI